MTPNRPDPAPALFEGDGAIGFDEQAALAHVRASDPMFARLIDAVGPFDMQLQATQTTFGALLEAIVYQQLTGRAAAAIFARVSALAPRSKGSPTAAQILRTSDDDLRAAGLSRAKVLAVHDLARKAVDREIPTIAQAHNMDDDAIVERLTMVRGIGRWTAEMFLIFRLGRPDVLPVDDYGIRKGFAVAFKKRTLPEPKDVARRGERWRPYRTVASWYLWRAAEQGR